MNIETSILVKDKNGNLADEGQSHQNACVSNDQILVFGEICVGNNEYWWVKELPSESIYAHVKKAEPLWNNFLSLWTFQPLWNIPSHLDETSIFLPAQASRATKELSNSFGYRGDFSGMT